MEVVVLCIAKGNERPDNVNEGCMWMSVGNDMYVKNRMERHTHGRSVLAEVPGLVTSHKTLGLDLGSGTAGKLLVEVHHLLHAESIR